MYKYTVLPEYITHHESYFETSLHEKKLFKKPLQNYKAKREFVIECSSFRSTNWIYPSLTSYELGACDQATSRQVEKGVGFPLFEIAPGYIDYTNSVADSLFLSVSRYLDIDTKVPFCKVYSKYFYDTSSMRYELVFAPHSRMGEFTVIMVENAYGTFVDTKYKGTKLRWIGSSRGDASCGSSRSSVVVLEDESPSLIDCLIQKKNPNPRNPMFDLGSKFLSGTLHYSSVESFPTIMKPALQCAIGRYRTTEEPLIPKFSRVEGSFTVLETRNSIQDLNSIYSVTLDSEVLLIMSLVLKKREARKNPPLFTFNVPPGSINRM